MKIIPIIKNIYLTRAPIYVIFFVTSVCNARCKMCFNWKETDSVNVKRELKLDEIKKIFGHFSTLQQLTISGGEPFLRKDLPEILGFISRNNKLQMITIPTNGIQTDLIIKQATDILDRIKKYTHIRISLSVEGIEEKHDDIVQVKGAFRKLNETYNRLIPLLDKYPNLNLDASICCSVFNKDQAKNLIKYCAARFSKCTTSINLARGDTRYKESKDIKPEEYNEIVDYYYMVNARRFNKPFARIFNTMNRIVNYEVIEIMKTKEMPSRCYAFDKLVVIQSDGTVLPCEYLGKDLGNLRDYDYDIGKILKANMDVNRHIKDKKCFCTWECALNNNIVCNPLRYPGVLKRVFMT